MTADQNPTEQTPKRAPICAALLALGIVLVFSPCWSAPTFITHEDSILRLPILSNWRNLPTIFSQEFMIYSDGLYRPFSYAVLAVLRTFVPVGSVWFWHAMLIALHVANALLVFAIVNQRAEHTVAALFAAAAFGLHPLAAVPANNINNFFILLSVTLYLCSFLGYLTYRRRGSSAPLIFAIVSFSIGLLTSPIVATLLIVLIAYELLYLRRGLRKGLIALLPFVVLTGGALWLYIHLHPHPVLYSYESNESIEGSSLPSFFTIIAGGYRYAAGLLFGSRIPIVLYDIFTKIYTWSAGFLVGAAVSFVLLALAVWRAWRRDAVGLGILVIFTSLIPFATTAWNPVMEYVSWSYLYAPLMGLALIVGSLADRVLPVHESRTRAIGLLLLLLLVGQYGLRLCKINSITRTPVSYWEHVLALAPRSKSAQVELGRAYLAEGRVDEALNCLFTRDVATLDKSCKSMCRYYLRQGNILAAVIHAEFAGDVHTFAEVFENLNVPDHAESRLGSALSWDNFDTGAMKSLARVLAKKGCVPDARRWLERAIEIDPSDTEARDMLTKLDDGGAGASVVKPSRADWVRFVVSREMSPHLREEVLALGEQLPTDPVIQIRAAYALLTNGAFTPALDKFARLFPRLSSFSPMAAMFSWVLTKSGDVDAGVTVARKALHENARSGQLHYALGFALAHNGRFREAIFHYGQSLSFNPGVPTTHYHMGLAFANLRRYEDAVEHFEEVIKKKPDLAEAHAVLANALAELKQVDRAMSHYARAAQLAPRNSKIRQDWAVACYRNGRYAEAWKHVKDCRKLGAQPHPEFLAVLRAKMPEPKP